VFGRLYALLDDSEDSRQVTAKKGDRVEPETRENRAPQDSVRARRQPVVSSLVEYEPIDLLVEDAPDQVLTDAVAPINR
jgi:hypothetical protein